MNPDKKLLIAGGGYADIPLIRAAQKLGYYVITTGNRPQDLGHLHSDEYRPADFSDKNAMLDLATTLKVDAICPCCNDFSAISSAYVAEKLHLPGHDAYATSVLIHHKDKYRKFALENNIPTPQALGFCDLNSALGSEPEFRLPVIVKPVDLTGGKGIRKVHNHEEFTQAVRDAFAISRSQRIVIEEFVEGTRHGFSAFIRDGKVVFHFADDEYYYKNPYLVSAASSPSSAPVEAIEELIIQSEKIVSLLVLKTGIFHVQFILRDGQPIIIEICRRPPGDLYIKLVEFATGVDYPDWIIRGFCGETCHELSQHDVEGYFLRHCVMAAKPGVIRNIDFDPGIESKIIDRTMFLEPGEDVDDSLVTKLGIVFLEFESHDELVNQSRQMQELIRVDIIGAEHGALTE